VPVESGAILFPLLVLAHYRAFILNARYGKPGGVPARYAPEDPVRGLDLDIDRQPTREAREEAQRDYERALDRFEASEGSIENAFWCVYAPSAVALTVKRRLRWSRLFGDRWQGEPAIRLHTATDWLTDAYPEITLLQHHCDTLAIKAAEVLRGTAKLIALEWLFAEHKLLLAAAEERAKRGLPLTAAERAPAARGARRGSGEADRTNGDTTPAPVVVLSATGAAVSAAAPLPEITRHARNELLEIERYYDRAGNKAARIVYFWGMVAGTFVALGLAALLAFIVDVSFFNVGLGDPDARNFFVCFAAGALGALVSVLTRMKRESGFSLDYEVGRAQSFRLGSFRPIIGAVFGLVIYFAIKSELLQIAVPDDDATTGAAAASTYFLALLAFVGGFSERMTHVVLGRAEKTIAATFQNDDNEASLAPASPAATVDDSLARLERWTLLRDQGVLTDEELQAQKRALLGG
jgi:hypothetical protein